MTKIIRIELLDTFDFGDDLNEDIENKVLENIDHFSKQCGWPWASASIEILSNVED